MLTGLLVVACATSSLLGGLWLYRNLGLLLVVQDRVEPVDVIFSFAGEDERLIHAALLHRQFPEATWLISTADSASGQAVLRRRAVDPSRAAFVYGCTSTLEEVMALAAWLRRERPGGGSVGLVSSPWHMRRISVIAARFLRARGVTRRYYPVPDSCYGKGGVSMTSLRTWYENGRLRTFVVYAWMETVFDLVRAAAKLKG